MKITSHGFFVLRRPMLALEDLESFHRSIQCDDEAFEKLLIEIFKDPLLLEAIHLSSPILYKATLSLIDGTLRSGKRKVLYSLYKYYIRMCSRCTPFGLFAGYTLGQINDQTKISFKKDTPFEKRSRLDSAILLETARLMNQNRKIKNNLKYYPNGSRYQAGNTLRYIKATINGADSEFTLSETTHSSFLSPLLEMATGGLTTSELLSLLIGLGLSKNNGRQLCKSLIESQLLISELQINLSGEDFFTILKRKIDSLDADKNLHTAFQTLDTQLKNQVSSTDISQTIRQHFPDSADVSAVHTDLFFPSDSCQISEKALESIMVAAEKIAVLAKAPSSPDLAKFAQDLHERFNAQAVPLLSALDDDYGVGYGSISAQSQNLLPLLEGLSQESTLGQTNSLMSSFFISLLEQATSQKKTEVELTESMLEFYHGKQNGGFGESFFLFGSLIANSETDLDQGKFLFDLVVASGPSAAGLLTRFAQADSDLNEQIKKVTQARQSRRPDVIFAEILHAPDPKAANILRRPHLGTYEIPYLTASTKPLINQIPLQDVLVSSVDGKTILLTSKTLQKQIIPTLTSAHNYQYGIPAYRFLCDVAAAENKSFSWDWQHQKECRFLPRVRYKKLIISKASWLLKTEDLGSLVNQENAVTLWWKSFETRYGTPRYFQIGQGDHTLLIDSQSSKALELIVQTLKKTGSIRLTEWLHTQNGLVKDEGRTFCHELIIPLQSGTSFPSPQPATAASQQRRGFPLGSSWLYIKIYCGERLTDELLSHDLGNLLAKLQREKTIEKWFFIRYKDPRPHIRLRVSNSSKLDFWPVVLRSIHAVLSPQIESGIITIQTDHYQRELERYAPIPYDRIENLFCADSESVLHCLRVLLQANDPDLRWLAALKGTDALLSDLGLNPDEKLELTEHLYTQFAEDFDSGPKDKIIMDQKYRLVKDQIVRSLSKVPTTKPSTIELHSEFCKLSSLFEKRSLQISRLFLKDELANKATRMSLATNLVHLFLNRWFFTQQRRQEFVVYHFLRKYYKMKLKCNQW